MKKLLIIISCLDLNIPLGCTPAWWQLMKGISEQGIEIVCTPYLGNPVSSFWWQAEENPCSLEAKIFSWLKNLKRVVGKAGTEGAGTQTGAGVMRLAIDYHIRPRWKKHLSSILNRHPDIEAVLTLNVPPNHFRRIPQMITEEFDVPVFFYDGDTPASLPEFGGFASGFQIYQDADLSEYTGVICNSEGVHNQLKAMGAIRVDTLHWGADPDIFRPRDVNKDVDIGFYGIGERHREGWMRTMIGIPSRTLIDSIFTVYGTGFSAPSIGRAFVKPIIPFQRLPLELSRIRIHLNITRASHARVPASSSTRLFEIAAMAGCIVSNPLNGLDKWFAEDEICIVQNSKEATETYRDLLKSPERRSAIGARARARVLEEHTYIRRAKQLIRIIHG